MGGRIVVKGYNYYGGVFMKLEKLSHVNLREQWADEARDFTPWLAGEEGLKLLGEALGMELELEDTEVSVGNYRADIVAKDSLSNDYVVIENQLSSTDHDHIGKLYTYAASFGATTLVWIAEKMREEHRRAIDWFNETTVKEVDFFGIEIELLRIGDSALAPNLKIVSKPNEWTRSVRVEKSKLTEGGSLKLDYWASFNEYIQANNVRINQRKPHTGHWYDVAIGKSGVHITNTVRFVWGNDIGCELYIGTENAKNIFHELHNQKSEIESKFGCELEWKELPEGKVSRIVLRNSINPNDKGNWDDCFEWYSNTVDQFRTILVPLLK